MFQVIVIVLNYTVKLRTSLCLNSLKGKKEIESEGQHVYKGRQRRGRRE